MSRQPENERIAVDDQRRFWNTWNAQNRTGDWTPKGVYARQAEMVTGWISALNRTDLDILEVGCGSGWLSSRLDAFGKVTGTDLANEVLPRNPSPGKGLTFVAGDFFELAFPSAGFDVVVSLEMLAHVEDQAGFVAKTRSLLRPGGYLMLATQNKFTLSRWSEVAPPASGQIRKWLGAGEVKRLLAPHFQVQLLTSINPVGDRGILSWVNAPKLNRFLSLWAKQGQIESAKERLLLGHTLMILARKSS
jgi:SAM-dependent methyltransferase